MGKKNKKKNKGPRDQHFVPRCYLSEFTDPNTPSGQEPYVWVFDKDGKNPRKRAPKNIFTETHLYTFDFNGEKDFSIEQSLSTIEAKYAYVFRRKIKQKKPLTEMEHAYLCAFVAAQMQRTPRFKRNQENFIQQLIDHGTQMALAHGVTDSPQVRQWQEYKKDVHKLQMVEGIPLVANILMQMSVAFLCSKDPSRHWFVTSDDPCVFFNPDLQWQRFYGPGFGQQNVQLTLALSPEITVMFTWANFHGYSYVSNGNIENMLNRMTWSRADKEFISPHPKKKWIWFSRIPLDPFFFLKVVKNETKLFLHKIYDKWRYRNVYARRK
jgi:hypothetical protein